MIEASVYVTWSPAGTGEDTITTPVRAPKGATDPMLRAAIAQRYSITPESVVIVEKKEAGS